MKKYLSLLVVLAVMICMVACAGKAPEGEGTEPAGETYKVAVILKNVTQTFDSWLSQSMIENAKAYPDMEVTIYDSKQDDAICIQNVENAVLQDVDLIILQKASMFDSTELVKSVVVDAGIPIVTINIPVNDGMCYEVPAPNYDLGYKLGEHAAETLPEGAKVLIFRGKPGDPEQERYDGLVDSLLSVRTDITVLAEERAFYAQDQAMALMEDWLQVYDDFDAILSLSDGMAMGALEACKAVPNFDFSKIEIHSVDGLPESVIQIKEGFIESTVQQNAFDMTAKALEIGHGILTGEYTEPFSYDLEARLISKDNVDEFYDEFKKLGYIS